MRKITYILILVVGVCIVFACSKNTKVTESGAKVNRAFILEKELYASYLNINEQWVSKKKDLNFAQDNIARSCQEYDSYADKYELEESVHNQIVKSEYLECDVLKLLSEKGEKIVKDHDFDESLGNQLVKKLDLSSFPSSLSRATDNKKVTLSDLFKDDTSYQLTAKGASVELESDEWSYRLSIVAVMDVDDNHIQDWVVWLADESKDGNYRGYSTLIIFNPKDKLNFDALRYP